jgi:hypothetical protein
MTHSSGQFSAVSFPSQQETGNSNKINESMGPGVHSLIPRYQRVKDKNGGLHQNASHNPEMYACTYVSWLWFWVMDSGVTICIITIELRLGKGRHHSYSKLKSSFTTNVTLDSFQIVVHGVPTDLTTTTRTLVKRKNRSIGSIDRM